jgi:hypothetical protein
LGKLGFGYIALQWMQNGIDKFTLTHGKNCDLVLICIEMIIVKGKQVSMG